MSTIRIMKTIPRLSKEKAEWCLNSVFAVIQADGVIMDSERMMIDRLSEYLEIKTPSIFLENMPMPQNTEDEEKEYFLKMLFLAAWVDGHFAHEEKDVLYKFIEQIGIDNSIVERAHSEVRKTLLISSIIESFYDVVISSEIGRGIIKMLDLSDNDLIDAIENWKYLL